MSSSFAFSESPHPFGLARVSSSFAFSESPHQPRPVDRRVDANFRRHRQVPHRDALWTGLDDSAAPPKIPYLWKIKKPCNSNAGTIQAVHGTGHPLYSRNPPWRLKCLKQGRKMQFETKKRKKERKKKKSAVNTKMLTSRHTNRRICDCSGERIWVHFHLWTSLPQAFTPDDRQGRLRFHKSTSRRPPA